jgi:hypothetical protein
MKILNDDLGELPTPAFSYWQSGPSSYTTQTRPQLPLGANILISDKRKGTCGIATATATAVTSPSSSPERRSRAAVAGLEA